MKKIFLLSALLVVSAVAMPGRALADQQPEMIMEKMAIKFTRGITNLVTSVAELPKQTVLTSREMGGVGVFVGPVKGVGMTLYRGVIGIAEADFCMVPKPGFYVPMMDPAYVWEGWEPRRDTSKSVGEEK